MVYSATTRGLGDSSVFNNVQSFRPRQSRSVKYIQLLSECTGIFASPGGGVPSRIKLQRTPAALPPLVALILDDPMRRFDWEIHVTVGHWVL